MSPSAAGNTTDNHFASRHEISTYNPFDRRHGIVGRDHGLIALCPASIRFNFAAIASRIALGWDSSSKTR